MKKLLSLTNLLIIFFFFSCTNIQELKTEKSNDSKVMTKDSMQLQDTINIQSGGPRIVGKDNGIKKDTTPTHKEVITIMHPSPEQAKIDSIKKAKGKIPKK